jgi:hypothetical protein
MYIGSLKLQKNTLISFSITIGLFYIIRFIFLSATYSISGSLPDNNETKGEVSFLA